MNIPVVIFIRSYRNDLEWLKYCLRSIEKFVTGHTRIDLLVPVQDWPLFSDVGLSKARVHTVVESMPGYIQQQVDKMHADMYCGFDDPWIVFFDSDCIFTEPFDVSELFEDGKPLLKHTPYAVLPKPPVVPWKAITELALGYVVHDEFMRSHGAVYRASELAEFRAWFKANRGMTIDDYARPIKHNALSEFNLLGAHMWQFHHSSRAWVRTDVDPLPRLPLKQFWSYSGVEPHRQEIEKILT